MDPGTVDVGVWLSGCVTGVVLSVFVWAGMSSLINWLVERGVTHESV